MINLLKFNVETTFCVGDIHGEFKALISNIKKYDLKNCLVICCGDIGLGFEKPQHYKDIISKLNRLCLQRNVYIVFIRGNHDDPSYFDGVVINYSNVIAVSDYTVVQVYKSEDIEQTTPCHSILCVGGATSIDRTYRLGIMNKNIQDYLRFHNCSESEAKKKTKKLYWVNEQPVFNKDILNEIRDNNINIDTVCSHTCPSFAQPISKDGIQYWCLQDETLSDDINNERSTLDKVQNTIYTDGHTLLNWIYGHYHYRNYEIIDNVKYVMLDMMRNGNWDYYELKNYTD